MNVLVLSLKIKSPAWENTTIQVFCVQSMPVSLGNQTVFVVQFGINLHQLCFSKISNCTEKPLPRVQFEIFEKLV